MARFDLSGITFVKVTASLGLQDKSPALMMFLSQAAGLVSPLRDAWAPGGEDDRDTQEIVARMLAEIRQGGEEARIRRAVSHLKYEYLGLQKLC